MITDDLNTEKMKARFLSDPSIASQFPVSIEDAGELDSFTASCSKCGEVSQDQYCRGHVSKAFNQIMINAHAICFHCNTIYPLVIRCKIEKNEILVTYINNDGQWITTSSKKTFKDIFKEKLLSILLWLEKKIK